MTKVLISSASMNEDLEEAAESLAEGIGVRTVGFTSERPFAACSNDAAPATDGISFSEETEGLILRTRAIVKSLPAGRLVQFVEVARASRP